MFEELINAFQDDNVVARLKTLSAFYKIVNEFPIADGEQDKEVGVLLDGALRIIRDNYWKNLSIEDMASDLRIDRRHLHNIFRKQLDISPKRFLDEYRLSVAFELLCTGNHSVQQISQVVGYGSVQTFSKAFINKYAISPSEHMRQHRGLKKKTVR